MEPLLLWGSGNGGSPPWGNLGSLDKGEDTWAVLLILAMWRRLVGTPRQTGQLLKRHGSMEVCCDAGLWYPVAAAAIYLLSCVRLFCDPMDCGPPDTSVHGISQARILEWVAMASPRGSSQPRD